MNLNIIISLITAVISFCSTESFDQKFPYVKSMFQNEVTTSYSQEEVSETTPWSIDSITWQDPYNAVLIWKKQNGYT